jgi:predicted nucleotide-binding protein (sugar kinase/HSP70/actin superfamily)
MQQFKKHFYLIVAGYEVKRKEERKTTNIMVGIPRALLYFKYGFLWESFFSSLGIKYILSPETNKEILTKGINIGVDETCIPSKIYLGHIDWLIDRCDVILIPRIAEFSKSNTVCTKYQAMYDVVRNTFRKRSPNLLLFNIEKDTIDGEVGAFIRIGMKLGRKKPEIMLAYWNAKVAAKTYNLLMLNEQKKQLTTKSLKILVIAHAYNSMDSYIGKPLLNIIKNLGVIPILGNIVDEKTAIRKSEELSKTLPWIYNKELLGAIAEYKNDVDGIILVSSFPCGPDSMVNEIIVRRVRDIPILNLILDGQEGTAGLETRIESFIDIIKYRKGKFHDKT